MAETTGISETYVAYFSASPELMADSAALAAVFVKVFEAAVAEAGACQPCFVRAVEIAEDHHGGQHYRLEGTAVRKGDRAI